ncbi:hypothetical protein BB559_007008 [Furculomyces boomerangus]|uniref:GTP:AMP phosphotransferase, mitochondrial n=2 Tax=Harpellales TaxID=61421 RepID=A0A2T9XZH5_9FUNG|nr:hypothetical protein BB559_007008 [Furculomyces boomerangus]PWA01242.1 hypothetical protein BB558_002685 [Smittium angustum]
MISKNIFASALCKNKAGFPHCKTGAKRTLQTATSDYMANSYEAVQLSQPEEHNLPSKTITGIPLRGMLLGAPGAGKGTQTERIKNYFDITAVSSGNLLRQNIAMNTQVGIIAKEIIERGDLVPDNIMVSLIENELAKIHNQNWLLDGFPRNVEQAQALDRMLENYNCPLNMVVSLDVPQDIIIARITERYVHIPSGRVYNLTYNPPVVPGVDDITGEPLVHRPDDNPDTFRLRLDKYNRITSPLLDYYAKKGVLRTYSGNTSDIIFPQIYNLLSNIFIM